MIALSLAAKFPEAKILAVDVSNDALALAQENASRLNLTGRVRFLKSRLLENVEGALDLIVANLPYVSMQDRHTLSREVLRDPEIAIFAGAQGVELVQRTDRRGSAQFQPNGMLALEIGIGQSEPLLQLSRKRIIATLIRRRIISAYAIPLCQVWIRSSSTVVIR